MTRIFFWTADTSGCAYYRCELPARALAARGHTTAANTIMPDQWLSTAEVIVGQRVCNPGSSLRWQQLAKEGRARLVYELDDDLLDVDPTNGPAWPFFSQPEIQSNIKRNIQVADLVTVSTEPLAERARQLHPNVVVLPNCVPAALLDVVRQRAQRFTVGWSGGMSHTLDLAEITGELRKFLRRNPNVGLHLMGGPSDGFVAAMPAEQRRVTRWIASVEAFHAAVDFDVSLAPLRPSPFNSCKSALRCLEAAALGVPVVASDYGPYAAFVRHCETGLLARRPHEWGQHLRTLRDDTDLRAELGTKARALAEQFTIERNIELWERALTT